MYDGNRLPDNEVGILFVYSKMVGLQVDSVDGRSIDYGSTLWVDKRDCQIHLLPGEHTILIRPLGGESAMVGDRFELIPADYGQVTLRFPVEAGHSYSLEYEHAKTYYVGRSDVIPAEVGYIYTLGLDVGSKKTVIAKIPYVWHSTKKARVSTIVKPQT
jgi:hypothetical protein